MVEVIGKIYQLGIGKNEEKQNGCQPKKVAGDKKQSRTKHQEMNQIHGKRWQRRHPRKTKIVKMEFWL